MIVRDLASTQVNTPWVGAFDLPPPGIAMIIHEIEFQLCFQVEIGSKATKKTSNNESKINRIPLPAKVIFVHTISNEKLAF